MNVPAAFLVVLTSLAQTQNVIVREIDDPSVWQFTDGSIALSVVDEDGMPVPDAEVFWIRDERLSPDEARKTVQHGTTDAKGICTLSHLGPDRYFVHVRKGDLGWWGDGRIEPDDKHPAITAVASLYRSAKGRVIDGRSEGLAGVELFVNRGLAAGVTDSNGRFRIPNLQHQMPVSLCKEGQVWIEVGVSPDTWLAEYMLPSGSRARIHVFNPNGVPLRHHEVGYSSVRENGYETVASGTSDDNGIFLTPWLPIGRELSVSTNYEADGTAYHGRVELDLRLGEIVEGELRLEPHWNYSITPSAEGKQIKTYTRINPPASARVSGQVVMATSGEPVQARIAYDPSFEWVRRTKGHTEPDGSFSLDGVPFQRLYITAFPDDPALYCVGGLEQIDLTNREVLDNLVFQIESGCGIEGRVLSADGLPYHAQVSYSPIHGHYSNPVFSDKDNGTFRISNLPPSDDGRYKLTVSFERADKVTMQIGPLEPGLVAKEVVIQSETLQLGKPPLGVVKGIVTDEDGKPVSGARIALPGEYGIGPATSDDAGEFRLNYHTAGEASITVTRELRITLRSVSDTLYQDCAILEGDSLRLSNEATSEKVRIVIRVEPPHFVAGTIVDEAGNPLKPQFMRWFGEQATGTWHAEPGKFLKADFPPGAIALEFSEPGYQSVVLFSGRDFMMGDGDVRVVMRNGPFPEFESVFTAVTGYEPTERSRILGGKRIWERVPMYREYAGDDGLIWLVVQDDAGKPVQQIEVGARNPLFPSRTEESVLTGGTPTIYKSHEGRYKLRQESGFVSAPGFGTEWISIWEPDQKAEVNYLTLHPASTVALQVVNANGQPLPSAKVFANKMISEWPRNIDTPSPATRPDSSGLVTFESLSPGEYEFFAVNPASNESESVRVTVEPGKERTVTIAVGK